jgi:predicted nuclease of predicted toxin-antitoxin system
LRVKLDENLPESCRAVLAEFDCDTATVREEGLAGSEDAVVIAAVRAEQRMLLTLDRGFGDIRAYPPGSHSGIVVLRLHDQRTEFVVGALRVFLNDHRLDDLRGCVVVVQRGVVRINWPDRDAD